MYDFVLTIDIAILVSLLIQYFLLPYVDLYRILCIQPQLIFACLQKRKGQLLGNILKRMQSHQLQRFGKGITRNELDMFADQGEFFQAFGCETAAFLKNERQTNVSSSFLIR